MEKDSKQFLIQGDVYEVEKLVGIKIVKVILLIIIYRRDCVN